MINALKFIAQILVLFLMLCLSVMAIDEIDYAKGNPHNCKWHIFND